MTNIFNFTNAYCATFYNFLNFCLIKEHSVLTKKKRFYLLSEDCYSSDLSSILEPWLYMTRTVTWLLASAYMMSQLISTWPLLEACVTHCSCQIITFQLETLRERRPPLLRQIITPTLPTVKNLSHGSERLNPPPHPPPPHPAKKKKKKSLPAPRSGYSTTIWCLFWFIYSSKNTQITTKI